MTLVRYNPFATMNRFDRGYGRLFNELMNAHTEEQEVEHNWRPRADIFETESKYTIQLDLPGVKREDVDISVEDDVLTISGERITTNEEGSTWHRERVHGKFSRRYNIRNTVDVEKIDAAFSDGVLTLTLPKNEAALPKKIEISSN